MNNLNTNINETISEKIFTLAVLLSPILSQYISGVPGVMLADIVLAISYVFILITKRNAYLSRKNFSLVSFWLYGLFVSLISYLVQQYFDIQNITRFIRYSFYLYLVIVSNKNFLTNYAIRVLKLISITISVYIIAQVFLYYIFGVILPFKILPIPLQRAIDFDYILSTASNYYFRPYGVFVEPGYAAQFLLPGLAFSLYGWFGNNKIDIKNTVIVLSALIMTTSAQGIFIGMIILGFYTITRIRSNRNLATMMNNIIIIVIALSLFVVLINNENVERSIKRVTGDIRPGSSVALRVYRGYAVFSELPTGYKIIGVGHGNLGNFVLKNSITTKYDPPIMTEAIADYVNGISAVLLYYGVPGLLLLVFIYWKLLKNTKQAFRLIVISHIVLSFVGGGVMNIMMLYYFSLMFSGYNIQQSSLWSNRRLATKSIGVNS